MSEVQVSGNLINLYKHIQKAHKRTEFHNDCNPISKAIHFPASDRSLGQRSFTFHFSSGLQFLNQVNKCTQVHAYIHTAILEALSRVPALGLKGHSAFLPYVSISTVSAHILAVSLSFGNY